MDKRTVAAFILIGLIIFFYGDFIRWISPPPLPEPISDSLLTGMQDRTFDSSRAIQRETVGALVPLTESGSAAPVEALAITDSLAPPPPQRFVNIETERYSARISSQGGSIVSLQLKPYKKYLRDPVQLIPKNQGGRPQFRFWTLNGPIETSSLAFALEDDPGTDDVEINLRGSNEETVTLTARLATGRALKISYKFTGDKFQLFYQAEGVGTADYFVRDYAEVIWNGGLAYTEADTAQDHSYSQAYTFFAGDVLEELKVETKNATAGPAEGETRWGALRTKYFMVAILPETARGTGSWMESRVDSTYRGDYPPNQLGVGIRLPLLSGSPTTPVRLYAGPIDDELLAEVDPTLKRTMNFGWKIIAPFSKAILWGLKAMFAVIPNYGVCIILFSIIIKLVIWPLTHKQYASMAAMQRVQPRLTAMREKYKGDPQRLNKEMMKLYKDEKINPMGGCLPMLLQLPLLYGLFMVFRSTIEFRQAPFTLWIHDLSMPDFIFPLGFHLPLYGDHFAVLPVLMAVTTFYQSKSTMTDPNQKAMLYMMPVMMLLIFNTLPSGLNLYYSLFNIWTLIQQWITPFPSASTAAAKSDD